MLGDEEPPALVAMRALAQVVTDACSVTPPPSWLALQVRLRATADGLVTGVTNDDARRDEVLLASQAYLELMMRTADNDEDPLRRLQLRSERYLRLAVDGTRRVVTYGRELLSTHLRDSCTTTAATATTNARDGACQCSCSTSSGSDGACGDRPPPALLGAAPPRRISKGSNSGASSAGASGSAGGSGGGNGALPNDSPDRDRCGGGAGWHGGVGSSSSTAACSAAGGSSGSSIRGSSNAAGNSASSGRATAESSSCVLTLGFSRYVTALLLGLAQHVHYTLLIAEGRPSGDGHRTARELMKVGVPVRMIEPSAISRCMTQVQVVICGAHAVLGDGGVVAHIGTLTMAYAARAHGRPFYVAAPHYAFSTTHHLDAAAQTRVRAVPAPGSPRSTTSPSAPPVLVERPLRDATPPQLITLLLTDVGVLTPSAVADEMLERQRR